MTPANVQTNRREVKYKRKFSEDNGGLLGRKNP